MTMYSNRTFSFSTTGGYSDYYFAPQYYSFPLVVDAAPSPAPPPPEIEPSPELDAFIEQFRRK